MMKKITIITINYNNANGLLTTLESVIKQGYSNYEHIIIDGGSTDNSLEIINKYATHIGYWVSEKDNGIYHAMNKGILKAQGNYLLFLNSGDFLEPGILNRIDKELSGEDIIYGDLHLLGKECLHLQYPEALTASLLISPEFSLPHPASFIKRELFQDNLYNEHYKIVSDWEFFVKSIILRNCSTKHVKMTVSNFSDGGVSLTNKGLNDQEREEILENLLPPKIYDDLRRLYLLEQSPLCEVIQRTNYTKKFQKRARKLVLLLFKLNQFFKFKKSLPQ